MMKNNKDRLQPGQKIIIMKKEELWDVDESDNDAGDSTPARTVPHVSEGIFVRNSDYYCKILYADILWLGACNNYCEIHHKDGRTYCAVHPLVKVETKLPSALFVRIHRSYIVNIHAVDRFIGNMIYIGKQRLDVSRPYRYVFSCFDVLEDCEKNIARRDKHANCTDKPGIPIKK